MLTLFNSKSEVNIIYQIFAQKLGLIIRAIDIGDQKIDSTMLNTYKMVIAAFLVTDKPNQRKFFEKTFLMANISPNIIFRMFFFILNNANANFFK